MLLACSGHQYHFLRFQLPKKVQPQTSMWCRVELVKTLANRSNDNRAMKMVRLRRAGITNQAIAQAKIWYCKVLLFNFPTPDSKG